MDMSQLRRFRVPGPGILQRQASLIRCAQSASTSEWWHLAARRNCTAELRISVGVAVVLAQPCVVAAPTVDSRVNWADGLVVRPSAQIRVQRCDMDLFIAKAQREEERGGVGVDCHCGDNTSSPASLTLLIYSRTLSLYAGWTTEANVRTSVVRVDKMRLCRRCRSRSSQTSPVQRPSLSTVCHAAEYSQRLDWSAAKAGFAS